MLSSSNFDIIRNTHRRSTSLTHRNDAQGDRCRVLFRGKYYFAEACVSLLLLFPLAVSPTTGGWGTVVLRCRRRQAVWPVYSSVARDRRLSPRARPLILSLFLASANSATVCPSPPLTRIISRSRGTITSPGTVLVARLSQVRGPYLCTRVCGTRRARPLLLFLFLGLCGSGFLVLRHGVL